MSEKQTEVRELMNQRVVLTLYPELQYNFGTEDEITEQIKSLDLQLAEHDIDGQRLQETAVAKHYGIKAPLSTIVEVDFSKKVS